MTQQFRDRLRELEARVEEWGASFDPEPPDEGRANDVLRNGFGPTVSLYCESRTGGTWVRFDEDTFDRLESTMNAWLDMYAACYGVDLDGTFTIREAAELLVDTHSARNTAVVMTGVPER